MATMIFYFYFFLLRNAQTLNLDFSDLLILSETLTFVWRTVGSLQNVNSLFTFCLLWGFLWVINANHLNSLSGFWLTCGEQTCHPLGNWGSGVCLLSAVITVKQNELRCEPTPLSHWPVLGYSRHSHTWAYHLGWCQFGSSQDFQVKLCKGEYSLKFVQIDPIDYLTLHLWKSILDVTLSPCTRQVELVDIEKRSGYVRMTFLPSLSKSTAACFCASPLPSPSPVILVLNAAPGTSCPHLLLSLCLHGAQLKRHNQDVW